ncbi:hypothetical protein JAAARDRAFT_198619 [Jaapia argillacea MUCL 33604]|uniref:Uncharacterized protein n=1 Tax=Jaapia argillacea MUCL 33604 TaxID=933084 RepID=A0A067PDS6_9AGAM|nr:hypothetical protein JAAARDRAFT_198619 [Jaapia argillacea MUCL 33604]
MVAKVFQFTLVTTLLILSIAALPIPRSVVCVLTTWCDIAVFFTANYIAHATTIPTAPGAKWYNTAAWTILCLLLPFAGLGKSVGLILSHFIVGRSDLEKAWTHDALAVVVRSDDWEPAVDPEGVYIKLPRGFHELEESPATLPSATIVLDCGGDFERVAIKHVQIHGRMLLPKGYHLAYAGSQVPEIFPIMDEAEKRGGSFNRAVGSCREEHQGDKQQGQDQSTPDSCWGKFTRVRLSMEVKGRDSESKEGDENSLQEHSGLLKQDEEHVQKILAVTISDVTQRFLYHAGGDIASDAFEFEVSSMANQDHIPDGGYMYDDLKRPLSANLAILGIPIMILASFILPYVVVFIFSGFEAGRSTLAQRAWIMSWASSGQLSLLSFGLIIFLHPHFSLSTWKEAAKNSIFGPGWIPRLILPSLILLPIPAIRGFITVGKMLKEFGTCSLALV